MRTLVGVAHPELQPPAPGHLRRPHDDREERDLVVDVRVVARVHILTHTLHYGLGLFEGIRCYKTSRGPAIFRLPEHVSRLFEGAQIIGMQLPFTAEQITSAIKPTVHENALE